ncbi:MAG: hypothetical protein ABH873_03445 [Candidatus Firestonebacteria bacterium]
MEIKFTEEQYESLIKIIYLGDWLVDAIRLEKDRVKEFEEIEQYVYSFHEKAKLQKYIKYDREMKKFHPTSKLEEDLNKYIDEYDDEIFHDELVSRLSRRDFIKKYGIDKVKKMNWEKRIEEEEQFIEKYEKEFEKNGVENLEIKHSEKS